MLPQLCPAMTDLFILHLLISRLHFVSCSINNMENISLGLRDRFSALSMVSDVVYDFDYEDEYDDTYDDNTMGEKEPG